MKIALKKLKNGELEWKNWSKYKWNWKNGLNTKPAHNSCQTQSLVFGFGTFFLTKKLYLSGKYNVRFDATVVWQRNVSNYYMKKHWNIIIVLLSLILFACKKDNRKNEAQILTAKQLSGKAYSFSPYFDKHIFTLNTDCPCCFSNILFLTEKDFVSIVYCYGGELTIKGKYEIENNVITLKNNDLQVNRELSQLKSTDSTEATYIIKTEKSISEKAVLKILKLNGNIVLKTVEEKKDEEVNYGIIDKKISITNHINRLKEEGIWNKLE